MIEKLTLNEKTDQWLRLAIITIFVYYFVQTCFEIINNLFSSIANIYSLTNISIEYLDITQFFISVFFLIYILLVGGFFNYFIYKSLKIMISDSNE